MENKKQRTLFLLIRQHPWTFLYMAEIAKLKRREVCLDQSSISFYTTPGNVYLSVIVI